MKLNDYKNQEQIFKYSLRLWNEQRGDAIGKKLHQMKHDTPLLNAPGMVFSLHSHQECRKSPKMYQIELMYLDTKIKNTQKIMRGYTQFGNCCVRAFYYLHIPDELSYKTYYRFKKWIHT